jgi:hypothetical protein
MMVNVPGAVGVPLTSPLDVFQVSPGGNMPLPTEKV